MPDSIGTIPVPDLTPSGTFPFVTDYPHGKTIEPKIVMHPFAGANRKIEQRFLIGSGARKWRASFANLTPEEETTLRNFWDARRGPYQPFTYYTPNEDGTTTPRIVQFEDAPLSFNRMVERVETGITFVEVPNDADAPVYTLNGTLERFPDAAMELALQGQVQRFVPLLVIQPAEAGYPAMYLSNQRCTVGGQLYQARIVTWNNISQKLGGQADSATFVLGNADRVMRDVANSTDLYLASVEFSLYHVETGYKVVVWRGQVTDYLSTSKTEFEMHCTDDVQMLTLQYPVDRYTNTCWKQQAGLYNDGQTCPYAANGALDPAYPSADASFCDGGYLTPNGCKAHSMKRWYGGLQLDPQTIFVKDNSTGFFGMGRIAATATSMVSDSLMNLPVREIYTDIPIPVPCYLAAGRDEGDFYHALGVVGGPITSFGTGSLDSAGNVRFHKLDGQPDHTWPKSPGAEYPGRDPAGPTDYFSLNQSGDQRKGDPNKVFIGGSTVLDNYAAGKSFIVMRRADEKGFQLTTLAEHEMIAIVGQGMPGWVWTAPGVRSQQVLTNAVWVAVHVYLRGLGLRAAPIEVHEQFVDIPAAVAAADICNLVVPKLSGSGLETQFVLRGIIEDVKPLKDWLQEILNTCMGSFVKSAGKLKIIIREDAAASHSFSEGNMVMDSLTLEPRKPEYNRVNVTFGNSDYDFVKDGLPVTATDHIKYIGQTFDGYLNLLSSGKSMAARIGGAVLKEQLGGATLDEWKKARAAAWKSTVLALGVEVGLGVSLDHDDMPGGTGLVRVTSWTLNPDYSLDFTGETITDSMYDQIAGPKLTDVPPNGVQVEFFPEPGRSAWMPNYMSPPAGDPLFLPTDRTFQIRFAYQTDLKVDTVVVTGERALNSFVKDAQPPIVRGQHVAGGYTLPAGNYYARCYAKDANGYYSPGSNIRAFTLDGATSNAIYLDDIQWPAGTWVGGIVCMGNDQKNMCFQYEFAGLPAQIVVGQYYSRASWNAPSPMHKTIRVRAKRGMHFGATGMPVSTVGPGFIQADGLKDNYFGTGNFPDLTGRWIYIYSDQSDSQPLPNHFQITAFNGATGTCTCTPDPAANGIQAGDLFTIRLIPAIFSSGGKVIGDPLIDNPQYPGGATNPELGAIIRGVTPGKPFQLRQVIGRPDNISYEVGEAFDYAPTYFVVERPTWEYDAPSTIVAVQTQGKIVDLTCPIPTLAGHAVTIGAFLVDARGEETPEEFAVIRESFCPTTGGTRGVRSVIETVGGNEFYPNPLPVEIH